MVLIACGKNAAVVSEAANVPTSSISTVLKPSSY
jgi:hypothetical protein